MSWTIKKRNGVNPYTTVHKTLHVPWLVYLGLGLILAVILVSGLPKKGDKIDFEKASTLLEELRDKNRPQ